MLKAETDTSTVYYTRGFELISRREGALASYYIYDGGLSVRALTNESGTVTDTLVFDAFGNETGRTGTTDNPYGFQGEEQDATGLYYLRARYMNPSTGVFTTMDTYGGRLSDPVSLHKYLFANSNPVKFSDPSGHVSLVEMGEAMLIGSLIGAALGEIYTYVSYFITGQEIGSEKYGSDFVKNTLAGFLLGGVIGILVVGGVPYLSAFAVMVLILTVMLVAALLISEYILTMISINVDWGGEIYGSISGGICLEPDGMIGFDLGPSIGIGTSDFSVKLEPSFSVSFYPYYQSTEEIDSSISVGGSFPIGFGSLGLDINFSMDEDSNDVNGYEGISINYMPKGDLPEFHVQGNF